MQTHLRSIASPLRALLALVLAVATTASAQAAPVCTDLRCRLEAMHESDQRFRSKARDVPVDTPAFEELWTQQEKADEANQRALEEIVQTVGWPRASVYGRTAAGAAFLVLQHSPLEMQERHLPALRNAVREGEAHAPSLAMLEDRILVRKGQPQRYGSQLRPGASGQRELFPIQDEANVDARRREIGLEPMRDYLKRFGLDYAPK